MALEPTLTAMKTSLEQARFGAALLLSDRRPANLGDERIAWRQIEAIGTRAQYSSFMLGELHRHVETSHALCIQWDGFVLSGAHWDPHFLDYDYIGAPWPHFADANRVGNGGFSLRSAKLLTACARLLEPDGSPEDIAICREHRSTLEREAGIRIAPEAVAARFAYERGEPTGNEFGFHGVFNLVDLLERREFVRILDTLETDLIARNELGELLRWALKHRDPGLAMRILKRQVQRAFRGP